MNQMEQAKSEPCGRECEEEHAALPEPAPARQKPLPGLGLVLCLLIIGILWTAMGAAQRVRVAALPGEDRIQALPDLRIDINVATEAELTLLPGIGPRLAERIVLDREANGHFDSLDHMTRVRWIGPFIVQQIQPYAFAGEQSAE